MESQETSLDKEVQGWSPEASNIKKSGRWEWNNQGGRKWTTSETEEKPGEHGILEVKQRKCFKEKWPIMTKAAVWTV